MSSRLCAAHFWRRRSDTCALRRQRHPDRGHAVIQHGLAGACFVCVESRAAQRDELGPCHCVRQGGAVYVGSGGSVTITETTLSSNAVQQVRAPALRWFMPLTLRRTRQGGGGGAIYVESGGSVTISETTLSSNTAAKPEQSDVRVTEARTTTVMVCASLCAARRVTAAVRYMCLVAPSA